MLAAVVRSRTEREDANIRNICKIIEKLPSFDVPVVQYGSTSRTLLPGALAHKQNINWHVL